jgi:COMPASS component SWD1
VSALATTSREGNILLWHVPTEENFAAFEGGFEEINENVVYEEREDEFDIEDEDTVARRKNLEEDERVEINDDESDGDKNQEMEIDDAELAWALVDEDEDQSWHPNERH